MILNSVHDSRVSGVLAAFVPSTASIRAFQPRSNAIETGFVCNNWKNALSGANGQSTTLSCAFQPRGNAIENGFMCNASNMLCVNHIRRVALVRFTV